MYRRDQSLLKEYHGASNLLNHDVNLISILHMQILGCLVLVETFSIEEESHVLDIELNIRKVTF